MKITRDNVQALYLHCEDMKRHSLAKNDTRAVTSAEGALTTLGFKLRSDREYVNVTALLKQLQEFSVFWYEVHKAYYKWIEFQDYPRDWFISAEIKSARARINASIRELTTKLLDICDAAGKVYDK